jgi:hypothetical protein
MRTANETSISRALFDGCLSWLCPIVYLFWKLKVRSVQHYFKKMAIAVFGISFWMKWVSLSTVSREQLIFLADPIRRDVI